MMVRRTPRYTLFPYTTLFRSDDGLIEIKSRRPKQHLSHVIAGQVPAENMAQIQCGLLDRKSTRLNSSHVRISYAVFCLKKKIALEVDRDLDPEHHLAGLQHAVELLFFAYPARDIEVVRVLHLFYDGAAYTEIYTLSLHDALPI